MTKHLVVKNEQSPKQHKAAKFELPEEGFVRARQVLKVFPVGRSTWWQGVRDGLYPPGVKLSERCTAWRVEDIRELIATVIEASK
ncbi:MAG TPA: AlpA family phage regulatory protein [Casimicrobiaceae bacterium]|nr:AlpA family phage regulatory protein [Casimicrobiaceae bacterium]